MKLTKQSLSEQGVVCKRVELMFDQHETIVTIPHNFILQQRVGSNCSLSEADIVQEVLTVLLGYNSVRDLEEAKLDCTAKRTEHGFKYIFRMDN